MGDVLLLEAHEVGARGEGVCFLGVPAVAGGGGQVAIHVPGLLPGERAQVRIEHVSPHRKERAWGSIQRRLSAAPERVQPACLPYGQCGGCVLQHLDDAAQLAWKTQRLASALEAQGLLSGAAAVTLPPCVPSPRPLGYRGRVKLVASAVSGPPGGAAGARIVLGAYAPRSHRVVDMAGCKVNEPALTALAASVAKAAGALGLSCYDEERGTGMLRYVLLRATAPGAQQVGVVVAEIPEESRLSSLTAMLRAAHPELESIVLHQNRSRGNVLLESEVGEDGAAELGGAAADSVLFGAAHVWETLHPSVRGTRHPVRLRVSARSFLQINRSVAERIYGDVAAEVPPGSRVLDLYCGVGGLGLTVLAADPAARVLGIEANPSAVEDATASAQQAGTAEGRAQFLAGAVEQLHPAVPGPGGAVPHDVALVNPPRRGCTEPVLQALIAGGPRRIVYVSCSPDSLARDLAFLCRHGYRLRSATPYDMHPGTPHVETVAVVDQNG